jgi:hypothetical protein
LGYRANEKTDVLCFQIQHKERCPFYRERFLCLRLTFCLMDDPLTYAYFFRDNNIQAPYQVDLAEYLGQLQETVDNWRKLRQSSVATPHLRLVADAMG